MNNLINGCYQAFRETKKDKMQKTISKAKLEQRVNLAKQIPDVAHLPSFGLVLSSWNFDDPALKSRAEIILQNDKIPYLAIEDVCQALFWYRDENKGLKMHFWE